MNTSIITGLQGVARTLTVVLILGLAPNLLSLGLVFFLTVFIYGRDRLVDPNTTPFVDPRANWICRHRREVGAIVRVAGAAALILTAFQPVVVGPLLIVLVLSLSYTVSWLPGRQSLKQLPGFKTPFVAIIWTTLTLGIPMVSSHRQWDAKALFLSLIMFLFMCAVVSINDIYDIQDDLSKGIKSLAVLFGESKTRALAVVFTLFAAVVGLIFMKSLGLAMSGLYLAAYASYVKASRGRDHGPTLLFYRASSFIMLLLVWLMK